MHHSQYNEGIYLLISFDFESLEFLTIGKSGIVYRIDKGKILKEYHDKEKEIKVERRAFTRLGSYANIIRYLDAIGKGSIVLKRG
jgi:hypothetical protein